MNHALLRCAAGRKDSGAALQVQPQRAASGAELLQVIITPTSHGPPADMPRPLMQRPTHREGALALPLPRAAPVPTQGTPCSQAGF